MGGEGETFALRRDSYRPPYLAALKIELAADYRGRNRVGFGGGGGAERERERERRAERRSAFLPATFHESPKPLRDIQFCFPFRCYDIGYRSRSVRPIESGSAVRPLINPLGLSPNLRISESINFATYQSAYCILLEAHNAANQAGRPACAAAPYVGEREHKTHTLLFTYVCV